MVQSLCKPLWGLQVSLSGDGGSVQIFFFFFLFRAATHVIWKFPDQGLNWSPGAGFSICKITQAYGRYYLQPLQQGILNPLSEARGKPASSWILVGFVSTEPRWEPPLSRILSRGHSLVAQRVKDLALLLQLWCRPQLRHGFHPWPRNLYMPWMWPKKKKKKKKKKKQILIRDIS